MRAVDLMKRGGRAARHPIVVARGARWAVTAHRLAREQLSAGGTAVSLPTPPPLPLDVGGVGVVLRILRATCFERSMVMQRWLIANGVERDVVIGVRRERDAVVAHAWLDGEEPSSARRYVEMTRVPPSLETSALPAAARLV